MNLFVWNMAISFQLLFIIVSGVIFLYVKKKSFKYYGLYNLCLVMYLLSRNDDYYRWFEGIVGHFMSIEKAAVFTHILCFYLQITFYNFYSVFALYFLDLHKRTRKFFIKVRWSLKFVSALFLILGIITFFMKNDDLYISFYTFLYLPILLSLFVMVVYNSIRNSGDHKYFFLFGVTLFVICGLTAFAGSFIPSLHMKNPIKFFYIGIVTETIFFSLGLAYKIKLMNDEKNRVYHLVIRHKHQQQISKLQGLLEGEEKERKRIAEELHDGIAGNLSAIKLNLSTLHQENGHSIDSNVLQDLNKIIDRSCIQIREISHNLSLSMITNYGFLGATDNFCKRVENYTTLK